MKKRNATIMTTREFLVQAIGQPENVWASLTTTESIRQFLFGIDLESSWTSGSRITGCRDSAPVLAGEVLFAEIPHRLSYALSAGSGQPEVYVTWELRAVQTGTVVRLCVDEMDAACEEIEKSWQPVVAALQAMLLASAS
jgi:uncharacterized protein YndB with AHSA1/START domain